MPFFRKCSARSHQYKTADGERDGRRSRAFRHREIRMHRLAVVGERHRLDRRIGGRRGLLEVIGGARIGGLLARRVGRWPGAEGVVAERHHVGLVRGLLVARGKLVAAFGIARTHRGPGLGPFVAVEARDVAEDFADVVGLHAGHRISVAVGSLLHGLLQLGPRALRRKLGERSTGEDGCSGNERGEVQRAAEHREMRYGGMRHGRLPQMLSPSARAVAEALTESLGAQRKSHKATLAVQGPVR